MAEGPGEHFVDSGDEHFPKCLVGSVVLIEDDGGDVVGISKVVDLGARRHCYVGYSTTTIRTIVDHLYATYTNISFSDLQDNDAKLLAPYNANLPIKALIDKVKGAVEYSAAGNTPYTLLQVVVITYQFIFQTIMFNDN